MKIKNTSKGNYSLSLGNKSVQLKAGETTESVKLDPRLSLRMMNREGLELIPETPSEKKLIGIDEE